MSALLAASFLFTTSITAQSKRQDRIAAHANLSVKVQLAGHIPTWANAEGDAGPVDGGLMLDHLMLTLQRDPVSEAAFQQLLVDQQDPRSPRYHHWLTPAESGRLYGATANDIAAVAAWLTAQGLRVDDISPTGISITFSGSSSVVARALSTGFRSFVRNGGTHYAIVTEPSVPVALAPVIGSFVGLSEDYFQNHAHYETVPMPASTSSGVHSHYTSSTTHFLSPKDFATIYDLNPAYNAGINGTGYRVAILGGSRVVTSDITTFETLSGLPANAPTTVVLPSGSDPGATANSAQSEATLDVDRVLATAPGSSVDLLITTNSLSFANTITLLNYEIGTLNDPIVNMSFGACETGAGSNTAAFNTIFAQGAAQGITWVASSGDSDAAGCDASFAAAPSGQFLNADFICASSYVTCVGGTQFADTASPSTYWNTSNATSLSSAVSYIPEGAWNEPTLSTSSTYLVGGTGGGVSTVITKPSWQTGVGVPADGFRDTPDVSFSASNHDGYIGCLAYAGADCVTQIEIFSGTSASAPDMAAVMAIVDQKLGARQGNFNPVIYRLAANPANNVFHDATPASSGVASCSTAVPSICNNSNPGTYTLTGGLAGYSLQTGYDQATGWGSIDVANLLTAAYVAAGGFTVSASPTGLVVSAGVTSGNTSTITYTSGGGFAGTISQSCNVVYTGSGSVTYIPTCSFSAATLTLPANGSVTSTVTIGSTVPHVLTASHSAPSNIPSKSGAIALSLLTLAMLPRRRLRRAFARAGKTLAVALAATLAIAPISGCGGSSSSSSSATQTPTLIGTTKGAYTVTVTGTSGSITQSSTISLTIQ